jgi:hypothetical protein
MDQGFGILWIYHLGIIAGYSLQTTLGTSEGKKMVVIK